jgi:hypothetical protein
MAAHEHFDREEAVQGSSDKAFGLVFTAFFLIVGLAPLWKGAPVRTWALVVSGLVLVISLLAPRVLAPANFLWTKLAFVLHKIMSPIALGVLFFLVATPTAFVLRLLKKDPLRLVTDPTADSYWLRRPAAEPAPQSMENQF